MKKPLLKKNLFAYLLALISLLFFQQLTAQELPNQEHQDFNNDPTTTTRSTPLSSWKNFLSTRTKALASIDTAKDFFTNVTYRSYMASEKTTQANLITQLHPEDASACANAAYEAAEAAASASLFSKQCVQNAKNDIKRSLTEAKKSADTDLAEQDNKDLKNAWAWTLRRLQKELDQWTEAWKEEKSTPPGVLTRSNSWKICTQKWRKASQAYGNGRFEQGNAARDEAVQAATDAMSIMNISYVSHQVTFACHETMVVNMYIEELKATRNTIF